MLTGESDAQQRAFYDQLTPGDPVLAFGAVHTEGKDFHAAPELIDSEKANNYRRWWNNPWRVVEPAGQQHAGDWTLENDASPQALVKHAMPTGYGFVSILSTARRKMSLAAMAGSTAITSGASLPRTNDGRLPSMQVSTTSPQINTSFWLTRFTGQVTSGQNSSLIGGGRTDSDAIKK